MGTMNGYNTGLRAREALERLRALADETLKNL